jgi:hypothetical protein
VTSICRYRSMGCMYAANMMFPECPLDIDSEPR